MIDCHRGHWPVINETAFVSPHAVISGDVIIGANSVVLAGAIISAQGASVKIGEYCVVMEHAVIRGAGVHRCELQDHILVGPHSHISGARLASGCFVGTGATIMNGAILGPGSLVAINGVVHIGAICPSAFVVPVGNIAIGNPPEVFSPDQADMAMKALAALGFTKLVFGFDSAHMSNGEATRALCERYAHSLQKHRIDRQGAS